MLSADDPLGEILKDIPEPTEEMVKSEHTTLTLDLIQGSRDSLGLWPEVDLGAVGVIQKPSLHTSKGRSFIDESLLAVAFIIVEGTWSL